MRRLPATVTPFNGETVGSVYRRLVSRNSLTSGDLWTAIRKAQVGLPLRATPELVPSIIAQLGGLPEDWFDGEDTRNRLFTRCIHSGWAHAQCGTCAVLPKPLTMCRRCTAGADVRVRARSGAFCLRHRRWHYADRDEAIDADARFVHAEKCLTGPLWARGIGLDTGELQLSGHLIAMYRQLGGQPVTTRDTAERLRAFYPEAIALTALLTSPWVVAFLRNLRIGHLPVAAMVETCVEAVDAGTNDPLSALQAAWEVRDREVRLRNPESGIVRYGRPMPIGPFGDSIRDVSPRLRGVFLRHDDARRPRPATSGPRPARQRP